MARPSFFDPSALFRRSSPRHARRAISVLPMIAVMPGEDVWFLRFALSFLAHLVGGGSIRNELTGGVVGDPKGPPFNYDHVRGGPLLWAPRLIPSSHLLVGHSLCPGFAAVADRVGWWKDTAFCGRGYDYFSDGYNYAHVPVDLAPHAYAEVAFPLLDTAAWRDPRQRAVLLATEPVEQAVLYYNVRCRHPLPAYSTLAGRPLADWSFEEFLLEQAMPSYAKIFISYQEMARQRPESVGLMPFRQVREDPPAAIAAVLDRITGDAQAWDHLPAALALARPEHLAAVEKVLGRPLDGRRPRKADEQPDRMPFEAVPARLHRAAREVLEALGVEAQRLPAPAVPLAEAAPVGPSAAGGARGPA